MRIFVSFFILILFASCSSIKMTKSTNYQSSKKQLDDTVKVLTQFDSIPNNHNLIGEFKMIENSDWHWDTVYSKLRQFALNNNANVIKIDEYHMNGGFGTKGNMGLVMGKLYEVKETKISPIQELDSIYLFVLRYEKDKFINAGFTFDLYINDVFICRFPNKSTYKIKVSVGDKIQLSTDKNKPGYNLFIDDPRNYYLSINKQVKGYGTSGQSIGVTVGDVDYEILQPILGKLEYENIIQLFQLAE